MKTRLFVVATVLVMAALNLLVWQKETVVRNGRMVLLDLAPADPRSLMQGDYMRLRYKVEMDIMGVHGAPDRGDVVVSVDARGVGTFARLYEGGPMAPNEQRLHYHAEELGYRVGPSGFYFQEGQAARFSAARYGELRVTPQGDVVLVGLRDAGLHVLDYAR